VLTEFNDAAEQSGICQANAAACIARSPAAGVPGARQTANQFAFWVWLVRHRCQFSILYFRAAARARPSGFASPAFVTALTPSQGLNWPSMFNTHERLPLMSPTARFIPLNFFVPIAMGQHRELRGQ